MAVDINDRIGFFSTAGFGGVPKSAFDALRADVDLGELIRELSVTGVVSIALGTEPGICTECFEAAQPGIFAFEWGSYQCYDLAYKPALPIFSCDAGIIGELARQTVLKCDFQKAAGLYHWYPSQMEE